MNFLKKFSNTPANQPINTEPPEDTIPDGIVSFTETEDTITYHLSGRIDVNNFESVQNQVLQTQKINIILDTSKVTYLSSAGLKMLLEIKKACDARGVSHQIINMTENVYRILKMTGFTSILSVTKIDE